MLCAIHLSVCRIATFDPQTSPVPSTSDEFIRVWNRQCPTIADKLRLLSSCGPDHMSKLFRAALPADLLSSILITLCSLYNPGSGSTGEPAGASSNMPEQEGADIQFAQAEGVMPGSVLSAESCSNADFIFDMLHGLSGKDHHCSDSCALCLSSQCSILTTCFLLGAGRCALTVRLINQSADSCALCLSSQCSAMTACFLLGAGRFALTVRLINQSARKAAIKLSNILQQAQNVNSGTVSYSADQLHQLQRDLGVYKTNS